MTQEPVLVVDRLTTQMMFGRVLCKIVEDISFKLYPGKTLALVGESGCGKTITALSIMRIIPTPPALPSQGQIFFKGKDLLKLSESEMRKIRGARIAMIFQDPISALNPVFTVGNQLIEVAELHLKIYGDEAIERAVKILDEVGIIAPRECLSAYPHQLSGGMKQRVMIAMALMCEPDILIADEPTTALDVTIQAQILALIKELQTRMNMAVLLITHDMDVVGEVADEVIVMYASQVMERGSSKQVFTTMSHPYTLGLFQSRPTLNTPRGKLKAIPGTVPHPTNYPEGCRFHPRCPFMMPKCKHGNVPDFEIHHEKSHKSKCWLYDESEESRLKLLQRNRND